jgi:DUF4097 and DUF4098 domain-containing protein YvlB
LANVNGNVRVRTWDRDEVQIDAIKTARKEEHLAPVKIVIEARADRIRVETRRPETKRRGESNSTSVEYTLTVPRACSLNGINTVNGNIEIEAVDGSVKANSVNGRLLAAGLGGKTELSTVNGTVKADFKALTADSSIKSVNGRVTVVLPAQVDADLSASTVNGGISNDFRGPVKRHFPVGSDLKQTLGRGGPRVRISTVNGAIRVDASS